MNLWSFLRVVAGLTLVGIGLWLFALNLPQLQFQALFFCTIAAIFIIEAPRFTKLFRQRTERIDTYVERTPTAASTARRGLRASRWGWVCYVAAILLICAAALFFRAAPDAASMPAITIVTLGAGAILFFAGFILHAYNAYARMTVEFNAASTAQPGMTPKRLWILTIGCTAIVTTIVVADKIWAIDVQNWMFGAGTLFLISVFVWRWLRGWPGNPP